MFEVDTVAFDMDGTLLDSKQLAVDAVLGAFNELCADLPDLKKPSELEIIHRVGNPSDDFYQGFLPDWGEHLLPRLRRRAFEIECAILKRGEASLFEGVANVLQQLKDTGYKLILVSNCGPGYLNAVSEACDLEQYFDIRDCIGAKGGGRHKTQVLRENLSTLESQNAIMVGDRIHDLEAARENDCHFAAALYGFGKANELAECDLELHEIKQLCDALSLTKR